MNEAVIWHDVENGGYDVDLPLWRRLAQRAGGPVLDLGAGTGRVALALAEDGHDVTALDSDPDLIEELDQVPAKVKPDEIKLAKQVIENFEGALDLAEYSDKYQEELQRIIDAKVAGEEVVASEEEAPPKVVNLMDALRQSLDRLSAGQKKAAKAEIEKPAKAAAPAKRRAR